MSKTYKHAKTEHRFRKNRWKKKSLNKKEQMQFILEGFPGIGTTTSKKLLEKFKSLTNIFNAQESELAEILGIKANIFKKIIDDSY